MLHDGIDGWLADCAEPEISRIVLIDAPAALGWERWREIGQRYGLGLVELAIQGLLDGGLIPAQPVRPLAHVLVGALEEGSALRRPGRRPRARHRRGPDQPDRDRRRAGDSGPDQAHEVVDDLVGGDVLRAPPSGGP